MLSSFESMWSCIWEFVFIEMCHHQSNDDIWCDATIHNNNELCGAHHTYDDLSFGAAGHSIFAFKLPMCDVSTASHRKNGKYREEAAKCKNRRGTENNMYNDDARMSWGQAKWKQMKTTRIWHDVWMVWSPFISIFHEHDDVDCECECRLECDYKEVSCRFDATKESKGCIALSCVCVCVPASTIVIISM